MTVVYRLEVTMELDDSFQDAAERCIMDDKMMQKWQRKVAKETARVIPNADVICTKIQVFEVDGK